MSTRVNMGGTAEPGFVPWGQGFFDGRKTWGGCMFQEVDPRQSFPELEQEIMQWWDEQNIVQKALYWLLGTSVLKINNFAFFSLFLRKSLKHTR